MTTQIVRILVSKEEGVLVAQCLEHDISVQAPDFETLQKRFTATIQAEAECGDLEDIPAAPALYFDLWDRAEALDGDTGNNEWRQAA